MARSSEVRPIAGRVVAISGAGRGIGKATARSLARRGARVAIGDLDVGVAEAAAEEIGEGVIALPLDVTDRDSFRDFVAGVEEQLGPIDVMVNNAGIMVLSEFLDEPPESIERQFAVNVMGVVNGMQLVLPGMIERGRGHVVNIASSAGKFANPGLAVYTGTKHAVVGITDAVRAELRKAPVDFSVVMPAIVETELSSGMGSTAGVKVLKPEEIADAIVEALETGRYHVWVPKSLSPIHKTLNALPLSFSDRAMGIFKSEQAIRKGIDAPERAEYQARIEKAAGAGQLGPGEEA